MEPKERSPGPTARVDGSKGFFAATARFWGDIYTGSDVFSVIHQDRLQRALRLVDELRLPPGSRVLDVGCGAGLFSIALTERELAVDAVDEAPEMMELLLKNAKRSGVQGHIATRTASVYELAFPDATFALVAALGLIPWLRSPGDALREMARVLEPGGHLIVNADNRARLQHLVDPASNRLVAPLKRRVVRALGRGPGRRTVLHSRKEFDRLLTSAGLERRRGCTFGFGPFTFLGNPLFSDRVGVSLNRRLQSLADGGAPILRSMGAQYLVLARKPLSD
jgi:ubiquinone/menaquinone biosynthesis C-methylase UbiE